MGLQQADTTTQQSSVIGRGEQSWPGMHRQPLWYSDRSHCCEFCFPMDVRRGMSKAWLYQQLKVQQRCSRTGQDCDPKAWSSLNGSRMAPYPWKSLINSARRNAWGAEKTALQRVIPGTEMRVCMCPKANMTISHLRCGDARNLPPGIGKAVPECAADAVRLGFCSAAIPIRGGCRKPSATRPAMQLSELATAGRSKRRVSPVKMQQ